MPNMAAAVCSGQQLQLDMRRCCQSNFEAQATANANGNDAFGDGGLHIGHAIIIHQEQQSTALALQKSSIRREQQQAW